jgi:hypothetical protein
MRFFSGFFNELTQFYHLAHCYHHEPAAMLAQMLTLMLGFVLLSADALLHCQPFRWGQVTWPTTWIWPWKSHGAGNCGSIPA